jgi:serine/threonine protein kinase
MTPKPGQRIGPYEIIGLLGTGGMGHVMRAWDGRLHREVALKLLREDFTMPGRCERFLREARTVSALNHPNICTVFDIGEENGEPYIVMELLVGETLRERMSFAPVALDDLLAYAEEIAEALAAAHNRGIVHRDIKPANIFLVDRPGRRPQVKVLDFGLAKPGTPEHDHDQLTDGGGAVGTAAYMSPEQARGEALDARSDLFSLGIVLYEMAAGQVPFADATSALIFVKLLREPAPPVRMHSPSLPQDVAGLIDWLLEKMPQDRPASADVVAAALHTLRLQTSVDSEPLPPSPAIMPTVRTPAVLPGLTHNFIPEEIEHTAETQRTPQRTEESRSVPATSKQRLLTPVERALQAYSKAGFVATTAPEFDALSAPLPAASPETNRHHDFAYVHHRPDAAPVSARNEMLPYEDRLQEQAEAASFASQQNGRPQLAPEVDDLSIADPITAHTSATHWRQPLSPYGAPEPQRSMRAIIQVVDDRMGEHHAPGFDAPVTGHTQRDGGWTRAWWITALACTLAAFLAGAVAWLTLR